MQMTRCEWAKGPEIIIAYHDNDWGVPVHDDRLLFEFLVLEEAQAGLNWLTILRKRENYRKAFDNFEAGKIAQYSQRKIENLLADPGIVRNRLKINATITNAIAFLQIQEEFGSFDEYVWSFVDGRPIKNAWESLAEIPASSPASTKMSKDLNKRGFKFAGTTICYAFMQAVGMVNDHTTNCFRYKLL